MADKGVKDAVKIPAEEVNDDAPAESPAAPPPAPAATPSFEDLAQSEKARPAATRLTLAQVCDAATADPSLAEQLALLYSGIASDQVPVYHLLGLPSPPEGTYYVTVTLQSGKRAIHLASDPLLRALRESAVNLENPVQFVTWLDGDVTQRVAIVDVMLLERARWLYTALDDDSDSGEQ